jgi:import inner membrane translocase subunit TIM16
MRGRAWNVSAAGCRLLAHPFGSASVLHAVVVGVSRLRWHSADQITRRCIHPRSTRHLSERSPSLHRSSSYHMQNYLVKAVFAGASLLGKSFIQAYRRVAGEGAQAKADKAAAGAAVTETSAFVSRRRMRLDEAKKVLNIEPSEEQTLEPEELAKVINTRYETLYTANSLPQGSFYLQSKIFRAKETLEEDFKRKYGISLVPRAQPAGEQTSAAGAEATKEGETASKGK